MKRKKSFIDIIKRILLYANSKYDAMQKDEIIKGQNKEIDVSFYKHSDFSWEQMREIRLGLEKNLDVINYSKREFSVTQMEEIRLGLERNLDISYYNKVDFDWKQMREIRIGLEKGLDVSTFSKSEFDIDQMEEIKIGLEKGLDVSYYNKPNFNWEQMRQVRIGLERNLDITTYAKPEISSEEMEKMRVKSGVVVEGINQVNQKSTKSAKQLDNNAQVLENEQEHVNTQDEFKFSKYDVNVIFKVIQSVPTLAGIEQVIKQRYRDTKEAVKQINIFKGRINKLLDNGYLIFNNNKYEITLKGKEAAKEINTKFEFTSYDANKLFAYIDRAGGILSLDNLREQLDKEYSNPKYAGEQFEYLKRRLDNNLSMGYVLQNEKGEFSISEKGAGRAVEINKVNVESQFEEEAEF